MTTISKRGRGLNNLSIMLQCITSSLLAIFVVFGIQLWSSAAKVNLIQSMGAAACAMHKYEMALLNQLPPESPEELFNRALFGLGTIIAIMRSNQYLKSQADTCKIGPPKRTVKVKPTSVKSLQLRFLPVFWLLRLAFWMSGPYFYQVYASKVFNGQPATQTTISRIFLVGFGSIAILGPMMGPLLDTYGRKKGTLTAAFLYTVGALSTTCDTLPMIFAGRAVGGLGTSLLGSAPEAWVVSEAMGGKSGDASFLSETFGIAYSYDPVVAIISGQISGAVAKERGPTGPFLFLPAFLVGACLIAIIFWGENRAKTVPPTNDDVRDDEKNAFKKASVRDGLKIIWQDKKLLMLGAIQSLFEGSMYIFVSQWPPAMSAAVTKAYGKGSTVPFGTVFSSFMACCMVGSSIFASTSKSGIFLERHKTKMLMLASASLAFATYIIATSSDVYGLVLALFLFEGCVGYYFPMMGTMRSKFLPDSHRSVIMSIYGIPLNVFVVSVFLFMGKLGSTGAFAIASLALLLASVCMLYLRHVRKREAIQNLEMIRIAFRQQCNVRIFTNAVSPPRLQRRESITMQIFKQIRIDLPAC